MFKNAKVVRYIPDQIGRGGTKTALSTQSRTDDVRAVTNAFVILGRWRTPAQPFINPNYTSAATIVGSPQSAFEGGTTFMLNNFPVYSTTNASLAPTNHLLSHSSVTGPTHYMVDHTSAKKLAVGGSSPDSYLPATMLNIKNRCFACWAGQPGQTTIYPSGGSRTANNVIYDPTNPTVTGGVAATLYDIGLQAPATASTYTLGGTLSGTCYVTNGSHRINNPTVSGNWSASTAAISLGGVSYTVQSPGGYVTSFSTGGTLTATAGNTNCTVSGAPAWPVNSDWAGLTIHITDASPENIIITSYTVSGTLMTIQTKTAFVNNHSTASFSVTGEELSLTTAYQAGTSQAQDYVAYSGALSWTGIGPLYAYAYYDPFTGHVSNVSPLMSVIEQNQTGVNVNLTNIMGSNANDQIRFTQILIFRTLASQGGISGGIGYPLGDSSGNFITLPNTTGAHSYTDSIPDNQLLNNGGLQWPLTTNRPPIGPLAHMAQWDGRVWTNPISTPNLIYFSGDNVQITFGIPEECYPSANVLQIPAVDGRVLGMKTVGGTLIITTARYSYTVVGGPNETTYRLARFSPDTFGVTDYQMIEFSGDTSADVSALAYIGGDGKIYILAPGYGNLSMSDPIQDILLNYISGGQAALSSVRMHMARVGAMKLLLVSVPPTTGNNSFPTGVILAYEFNTKTWSVHNTGNGAPVYFSAFESVYQTTANQSNGTVTIPIDIVMAHSGIIYSWLRNQFDVNATGSAIAQIWIGPTDFGRKSLKQINFIRIYVNGASSGWAVTLNTNESVAAPFSGQLYNSTSKPPLAVNPDPAYQLQPPNSNPVDDPNAKELIVSLPSSPQTGSGLPLADGIGYRFAIGVYPPNTVFPTTQIGGATANLPFDCYAIDVCYTDLDDQSDVSL